MIKKITLLIILVLITALLGGCWSRKELSDVGIVLGTGVDWTKEGRIQLTVQMAKPAAFGGGDGGGGKETASWVVSAEGKTLEDAERNLARIVPRDIYWGHCIILVIGEEMAKKGIDLVMNFFLRDRQPRENIWVMVSKGEAKKILESSSSLAKTSAQAAGFLTRMKTGYSVRLREFAEMQASKGIQPVATWVELKEAGVTPGPEQEGKTLKQVEISGVAILKEEKLIGWLDDYETRGLLWLKGEVMEGIVTVPSPSEPEKEVSIKIRRGKTKIIPEYDGENIRFNVEMEVEGDMVEQQSREDLAKPEMIKALEESMAGEIKKRSILVVKKVQKDYGVDIFGFGEAFHRGYKKDWKELKDRWDEEFTQAEVDIAVEAHIREIGLLTKRVDTKEE